MKRIAFALATTLVFAGAAPAPAAIPSAEKIARAVAGANQTSGRGAPLLARVQLRISDGPPSAEGELAVHPSGLARLELRNRWGFVERHLLQSSAYQASRDGEPLPDPHPFLPPIFLLQAGSGEALSAALSTYGIAERTVMLGRLDAHDCYVFGGRRLGSDAPLPSLWVDLESYEPLRIVRADGVEYRFGPIQDYSGIRLPRWVDIRTPSGLRARLEIDSAARAEAPAALFQTDWLAGR